MITYTAAFIFYTLAMIGILLIGYVVYKKTFINNNLNGNRGLIKILDSQPIGDRKLLHIIRVKNETFLIATSAENTTFLSKLNLEMPINLNNTNKIQETKKIPIEENFFNENYSKNFQLDNEIRFDDTPRTRANELQKQFRELYEKDEIPSEAQNKKEMMRKLLMSYQNGSKF